MHDKVTGELLYFGLSTTGIRRGIDAYRGALNYDAGLRYLTASLRAFSFRPSGLLRAGAFTFNGRSDRVRFTDGALTRPGFLGSIGYASLAIVILQLRCFRFFSVS